MKEEPATGLQNCIAGSLGTLIKTVPSSLQIEMNYKPDNQNSKNQKNN